MFLQSFFHRLGYDEISVTRKKILNSTENGKQKYKDAPSF